MGVGIDWLSAVTQWVRVARAVGRCRRSAWARRGLLVIILWAFARQLLAARRVLFSGAGLAGAAAYILISATAAMSASAARMEGALIHLQGLAGFLPAE